MAFLRVATGSAPFLARVYGALERAVHDALGGGLLAVDEHLVDQLRDQRGAVDGIDDEGALRRRTLTRHYFFSFLAP